MRKPRYREAKYPLLDSGSRLDLRFKGSRNSPDREWEKERVREGAGRGRRQQSRSCLSWRPRAKGGGSCMGFRVRQTPARFQLALSHSLAVIRQASFFPCEGC